MELEELDRIATKAFEGYVVRKDLALRFKGRYPVPEYVAEFLLGFAGGCDKVLRHVLEPTRTQPCTGCG